MNEKLWETRDGRIWIGDRWAGPKEVADHARDLAAVNERLRGAIESIRDSVLHERHQMAEEDFGPDRINAVLGVIDDVTASLSVAPPIRRYAIITGLREAGLELPAAGTIFVKNMTGDSWELTARPAAAAPKGGGS